jgi:hypothetical protein
LLLAESIIENKNESYAVISFLKFNENYGNHSQPIRSALKPVKDWITTVDYEDLSPLISELVK